MQRAYNRAVPILAGMIGTLFRFLILRVLGARGATVLAIVGVILGWRGRRAEARYERERQLDRDGRVDRTNRPPASRA